MVARRRAVATGYGVETKTNAITNAIQLTQKNSVTGPLFSKKIKATGSSAAKGGKLQVKLLKYVEGTGSIGDIVMVAPAFFENKLKRTGSAVLISDEEVDAENKKKLLLQKAQLEQALDMQKKIQEVELSMVKKAGPEGHLFGGVAKKDILEELKRKFPKGALDGKQIKIATVQRVEGEEVKADIKEVGLYTSTINLLGDITARFRVNVTAES